MSYAEDIFDRTSRRLDLAAQVAFERAQRDVRAMRRADDREREERRAQSRKDAARCDAHQRRYDEAFELLGKKAAPPTAGDAPPDYRRRLFALGQSMLPAGNELTTLDPEEIGPSEIIPLEKQLLEALAAEGKTPSGDNMAETPDDPRAKRERMDSATGQRKTEWLARTSFIAQMSRPGRRVLRIFDPTNERVLFGPPFPSSRPA
jgi:hypothetical protein